MAALLVVVGVVCLLAGVLVGFVAREWIEADPYVELAHRDRRRHA